MRCRTFSDAFREFRGTRKVPRLAAREPTLVRNTSRVPRCVPLQWRAMPEAFRVRAGTLRRLGAKLRVGEHEWRSSERDAHDAAMVATHFSCLLGAATSMAASGVEVSMMLPLGSHRCRR